MGVRIIDAWGGGVFGSPRGSRIHKGLDIAAYPCVPVISVFPECTVTRIGRAYADGTLHSIHLQGLNDHSDWRIKLLYTRPIATLFEGHTLYVGNDVGRAEDVSNHHMQKSFKHGAMTNHIHFALYYKGGITDPMPHFKILQNAA